MGIGTNTPDASSVLDISATDKGVLVPRLTTQQRLNIPNPADGLLVYDSDVQCFFFYQGVSAIWSSVCNNIGPVGPVGPPGPAGSEIYSVKGTGSLSATTSFIVAPGLSLSVNLIDSAVVNITTSGGIIQTQFSPNYLLSQIQVFINNMPLVDAIQTNGGPALTPPDYNSHWSISTSVVLAAGNYTFDVRGKKLDSCPFTFGSSSISSSALIVQVFY